MTGNRYRYNQCIRVYWASHAIDHALRIEDHTLVDLHEGEEDEKAWFRGRETVLEKEDLGPFDWLPVETTDIMLCEPDIGVGAGAVVRRLHCRKRRSDRRYVECRTYLAANAKSGATELAVLAGVEQGFRPLDRVRLSDGTNKHWARLKRVAEAELELFSVHQIPTSVGFAAADTEVALMSWYTVLVARDVAELGNHLVCAMQKELRELE